MHSRTTIPAKTTLTAAGLKPRVRAFAFDYLIIMGYLIILTALVLGLSAVTPLPPRIRSYLAHPILSDLITFLALVLPVILYFTLSESEPAQATWGKQRAGLQVGDAHGKKLNRKRAFWRNLVKFAPWQLAHTSIYHVEGWPLAPQTPSPAVMASLILVWLLVLLNLASLLLSKSHQTMYDWLSGAYVIKS